MKSIVRRSIALCVWFVLTVGGLVPFSQPARSQSLDACLAMERDRLLMTYNKYKSYGLPTAEAVFHDLEPERQAVFEASVRALFQELEHPRGHGTGQRPIDFLQEVLGIWGVRTGEPRGEFLFRLSTKWRRGIRGALSNKDNFADSIHAHVLLPVQRGGDDDPKFAGMSALGPKRTYRQKGTPSIQISFLEGDETTGEIDVDFDETWRFEGFKHCHTQPSNSDVGSANGHEHLERFRSRYEFFSQPIQINWTSQRHCQDAY